MVKQEVIGLNLAGAGNLYRGGEGTLNADDSRRLIRTALNESLLNRGSECFDEVSSFVVITSIAEEVPDAVLANQVELDGVDGAQAWCTIVVGDEKSDAAWERAEVAEAQRSREGHESTSDIRWLPRTLWVPLSMQVRLEAALASIAKTPVKSYTRKNIGFLVAVALGARRVYETDDDNGLEGGRGAVLQRLGNSEACMNGGVDVFVKPKGTKVSEAISSSVWNAYAHFGHPEMWPRGFPLSQISPARESSMETVEQTSSFADDQCVLVGQFMQNGDPDVDAITRLTTYPDPMGKSPTVDLTFDAAAPPLLLEPFTYCPTNTQSTLHLEPAFMLMFIPMGVPFRVCDIWRGYFAQRLLWLVNGRVAFLPPVARQDRNPHSYYDDFLDELVLYTDTEAYLRFMACWTPSADAVVLSDAALELANDLATRGFWHGDTVQGLAAFVRDMKMLGAVDPFIREASRASFCP